MRCTLAALLVALAVPAIGAHAQQPLETETARLPARHELVLDVAYEFQTSKQGIEHALPIALEYGVTDRLALLFEPVFFTAIVPRPGARAVGPGDLEITTQYQLTRERHGMPALALAAEEKLPTARSRAIGTGRADFTPYLIASRHVGAYDAHVNAGYSFMGRPKGLAVQNTLNLAAALERPLGRGLVVMGEFLSTSASLAGGEGVVDPNAPELAGAEQVLMLGVRQAVGSRSRWSLGVTYDNTNALLIRPGFSIRLR